MILLLMLFALDSASIITGEVVTADLKQPEYCGDGPVEVILHDPIPCPNSVQCSVSGNKETGYHETCWTTAASCWTDRVEHWTDYPECGGRQLK